MFDRIRSLFGGKSSDPRDAFLAEVEAIVRGAPSVAGVKRARDVFALDVKTRGGEDHRMFLDNHFVEMRELSPDERKARILASLVSLDADPSAVGWPAVRENLLPVLRGATFGEISATAVPENMRDKLTEDNAAIRRSFAPFLDVMAVVDLPTSMRYVTRATVKEWGLEPDAAIAAALDNFAGRASRDVELYDEKHGPLFVVSTNDAYESSRLLIPGWLASFRGKVEGDPIAIVPQREMLLVGGSARPEMVARLVGMADREFAASPRNISCGLYTVDATGKVVPYLSDATEVVVAHEKLAIFEYEQQTRMLKERPDAEDGPFVAKYSVYANPEGVVRSMAAWTDTVDTLLPKTRFVSLVKLNAEGNATESVTLVPWDAIGDRLSPVPGLHPPRFRTTREFPNDAELAELRSRYADMNQVVDN